MNMKVKIAGVEFKNPVMTASGTFGSGAEYSEFVDLNQLGAVVTKGVANVPWAGNATPRIAEVHSGMMNAIGLQNPGIDVFCERDIPFLQQFDTKVIVNVCGHAPEEYLAVVERLAEEPIDMMEINISCPNVNANFLAFGQDPKHVEELTAQIKKVAKQPVIMKLTPNVTDIAEIARAAEAGGADAVSLINTLTGMKIDINRRTFALANKTGGVSGPCVKPVAVRMVYQAAQAVKIPIIGMGGIQNTEDALEFIMAGATAVSIGTANFTNPYATIEVIDGIQKYMEKNQIEDIHETDRLCANKKIIKTASRPRNDFHGSGGCFSVLLFFCPLYFQRFLFFCFKNISARADRIFHNTSSVGKYFYFFSAYRACPVFWYRCSVLAFTTFHNCHSSYLLLF